jgi:subtilisin family serine protease
MSRFSRGASAFGASLVVGLSLGSAVVGAAPREDRATASGKPAGDGIYIVRLAQRPVTAYDGGIKGLKATRVRPGTKVDPFSPAVVDYVAHLAAQQNAVLARVGGRNKLHSYAFAFNGFSARLTEQQATALLSDPNVVSVTKDEKRQLDTATTPAFLGLTGTGGVWQTEFGGVANAGENVVVGIIDSGIWPENPSFSDRTGVNGNGTQDGKLGYRQIPGWNGRCVPGEAFPASACNQKVIAARWYNSGFGGDAAVKAAFPYEFASARGADGHGSHTAGTAAGNNGIPAVVDGNDLGRISGIAPRARLAIYKSCWGIPPEGGCFNSDSVAAIDQAVADGVDVINFSISGSQTSFVDPVEVAFLYAADAGVFVAASAGNSGPTPSTVAHNSPWLMTVAAGTHDRQYTGTVTLGNGATYTGASLTNAVPSRPLVLSTDAALPGADATAARLCFSTAENGGTPVLDPARVAGKIVVCDRGVNARTDKSFAVGEAGGVGMVLINTNVNSLNADLHFVPTVHLQSTDRAAVLAYAATAGATASLSKGVGGVGFPAPDVASFSSRGPALAGGGDLLKPDILAPGVDVLAAVSPIEAGRNFDFLSGTSMSSPHVAGLGALLKQKYPTWSAARIKSALMTTASQARNDGTPIAGGPFAIGAGHVDIKAAMDPGLVYDAGWVDWLGFLCGVGELTASYCPQIAIDPSNLNYPSIAIGALAGVQTVTRTVTNVTGSAARFTAQVVAPAGIDVEVSPSTLNIARGGTGTFTVRFRTAGAPLNTYSVGSLTWVEQGGNGRKVRSPLVIRPVALAAPASISSTGSAVSFPVTFGYTGAFSATARGLVSAAVTPGTVADDPTDGTCSLSSPNARKIDVAVPAGTTYARFQLFDGDVAPGSDLDLCVFNGTTQVGASAGGTSTEQVNLLNPAAGTYTVVVQGWGVVGSTAFELNTWLLGSVAAGNMAVSAPSAATLGQTGSVNVSFTGLAPKTKYLGSVAYDGVAGLPNPTIVRVDTP